MGRSLLASATLALMALATVANADPVALRFSFVGPDTETTWTSAMKPFIDAVNADAKGVLDVQPFANGTLGRNSRQQLDMVLNGVTDIAFILVGQTPGRFPDNEVMEMPGLFQGLDTATHVYTRLIRSGALKGYDDLHVVGAVMGEPTGIHTRTPLTSLAELKGKKIKVQSSTDAQVLRALGAAPVLLPSPETVEAISRGTIDGAAIQTQALVDFGIARVVSYHYMAGMAGIPLTVVMTKQKFDSLPKAGQDAIRKYSGDWFAEHYIKGVGAANDRLMKDFLADPKQKVTHPTETEKKELAAVFDTVVQKWAAAKPRNAEVLAALRAEKVKVEAGQ